MPEGDTIHRAATRLHRALGGAEVLAFEARRRVGPEPQAGETITGVRAVGKHLLVGFSGGLTLETHMKMTGSWHLYHPGESWRKPAHQARVVITTADWIAVCFSAPVVRLDRDEAAVRAELGPDLCRPDPDLVRAVERFRELVDPSTEIADVLLDQRVASGIGNVYKSEVLWFEGVSPFRPAGELDDELLARLLGRASELLRANLATDRRTTVGGGLAVYGRAGRACRRCGSPILVARQGPHARSTYWCGGCQPDERSP